MKYLVVGRQSWNRVHFQLLMSHQLTHAAGQSASSIDSTEWKFAQTSEELASCLAAAKDLRYIFFLHWSEKVPADVFEKFECVCFHMADVPFGRGGSPLQNLIERGHRETMVSALRMTNELDAGPVYFKQPMSLEGGTAEEIYQRASQISLQMAVRIASMEPEPQPQTGEVTVFKRRTPQQSELPLAVDSFSDLQTLFDHIRMLDAEGYPAAFLEIGDVRFEFTRPALYHDGIQADVKISLNKNREPKT